MVVSSPVPHLLLSREEYLELLEMQGRFGFSCNRWHDVWPAVQAGYHEADQRDQLAGAAAALDSIVDLVLEQDWRGRRFQIDDGVVSLADSDELIAFLRIEDHEAASGQ